MEAVFFLERLRRLLHCETAALNPFRRLTFFVADQTRERVLSCFQTLNPGFSDLYQEADIKQQNRFADRKGFTWSYI